MMVAITKLFRVLSDPQSLAILLFLKEPVRYIELLKKVGYPSSKASGTFAYHLRKLKQFELVHRRADKLYELTKLGWWVVYLVEGMLRGHYAGLSELIRERERFLAAMRMLEERWEGTLAKLSPPPIERKEEISSAGDYVLRILEGREGGYTFLELLELVRVDMPHLEATDLFYVLQELEDKGLVKRAKGRYMVKRLVEYLPTHVE